MASLGEGSEVRAGRRPWWRFALSVRALMVLVLVIGGLVGWKVRRVAAQRRAVAAIRRVGGTVEYDWMPTWQQQEDGAILPNGPPAPRWARRWLGNAFFQEVARVTFFNNGCEVSGTDAEVAAILREEQRTFAAREADQLACLDGLDRLEELHLIIFGPLRAEGLARLARLDRITTLTVGRATPALGATLRRLTRLESLRLEASPRPDATPEDSEANRAGVPVDLDLSFLDALPRLRELNLEWIKVDARAVGRIARLSRLRELTVDETELRDPATIHRLERAIPGLRIQWE